MRASALVKTWRWMRICEVGKKKVTGKDNPAVVRRVWIRSGCRRGWMVLTRRIQSSQRKS